MIVDRRYIPNNPHKILKGFEIPLSPSMLKSTLIPFYVEKQGFRAKIFDLANIFSAASLMHQWGRC
jgi:hypothetical protein